MQNKKLIWIVFSICAVAVCAVAIAIAVPRILDNDEERVEIPLPELDVDDDFDVENIGFCYCIYDDDYYRYVIENKSNLEYLNLEAVVDRYLKISNINETALDDIKIENIKKKETISEGVYQPAVNTYNIYLKGEELDVVETSGLINTVLSYTDTVEGVEYVKVFVDDEAMIIKNHMPKAGYSFQKVFASSVGWEYKKDQSAYKKNAGKIVDVTFTLKDENKNPVKNIVYYIENADMEEEIISPTGEITLSVEANNKYMIRLQKKNSKVIGMHGDDAELYEEMIVCFDVEEGFEQELIWKEKNVIKLDEPTESVIIDISEVADELYEDVLISVYKNGAIYALGYCEKDGTIEWSDYGTVADDYIVILTEGEKQRFYKAKISDGKMNILEETQEAPGVYE